MPVIITYPPTWTNPGIEDFEEISLDTTSEEYRTIKKYFLDTSRHLYNNVQVEYYVLFLYTGKIANFTPPNYLVNCCTRVTI